MDNRKVAAAAMAVAAASAVLLVPQTQARAEDAKVMVEIKRGASLDAIVAKLGKPSKVEKKGSSTINTWTDGKSNNLSVVTDSMGKVTKWSNSGPAFTKSARSLKVLEAVPK